MNELELYNPVDYDDEEIGLAELEAPKRRRRKRKNPEPVALAIPALLLVAYLGWCAYSSRNATWSWQPWKKLAGLTKPRLQLRQANNAEERRRAELHRHIEQAMKPSVITIDTEVPWRPVFADTEKERVSFIVP